MRYAVIYGALSGAIASAVLTVGIATAGKGSFSHSEWFGYLVMLVALTFVFVGMKRYRDVECGGVIRFWRAFALGLGIAAVAGVAYVAVFETYLAATDYRFIDDYVAGAIRARRAAGVTGAALARDVAALEQLRVQYADPLFRLPMTFAEIFPVGFVVALVSAAVLRNPRLLAAPR